MNRRAPFTFLCVAVLLAVMAGCSSPTAAPPAAAPSPTTAPPSTLPPATVPPPTLAPPSPTPGPFPGLAEWDLLIISDSSNAGVGKAYAKLIEADMGVKVKLHDCWVGNMQITAALEMLQGTSSAQCDGKWPDLIRDAEVIVLHGGPAGSPPPSGAWNVAHYWIDCVSGSYAAHDSSPTKLAEYKSDVAKSCAPETFVKYRADLGAVFDGIFKLRAGRPVILRATDFYVPVYKGWDDAGVRDVCTACLDNFVQAIHETAAEYGVPVASTMDAFNGPDRQSDPVEKGYISKVDGIHPSVAGAQRMAQALQQTGYGYAGK